MDTVTRNIGRLSPRVTTTDGSASDGYDVATGPTVIAACEC